MRAVVVVVVAAVSLVGCFRGRLPVEEAVAEGEGEEGGEGEGDGGGLDVECPGGAGCADVEGAPLLAGAAQRDVTPTGFEIARFTYLDRVDDGCAPESVVYGDGHHHCGVLKNNFLNDCGTDGLCSSDPGWVAADADGSEADEGFDTKDYFLDCGRDQLCEGDDGYTAPDADGSEGDGIFQALWLAGFDNNRPAMGIKDRLQARAVVFRQGETTLAVCTVDAIGLFFDEQQRIQQRLDVAVPGEVDLFLLQATHTHEAPDTMGQWGFSDPFGGIPTGPGRDEDHMELIREGCKDAVVEALDELVPVVLKAGQTHPGVAGLVRDNRDPVILDDSVTVLSLEDVDDGSVVATVVNWGSHPESLGSDNNDISADWVGAARTGLEEGLAASKTKPLREGRAGTTIFWQGPIGGQIGPGGVLVTDRFGANFGELRTWGRTDAMGENVAELAFAALEGATVVDAPKLRFVSDGYQVPVENTVFHVGLINGWFDRAVVGYDPDAQIGVDNVPKLNTAAAIVKFGDDVGFVTSPGEMHPETFVGYDAANAFGEPVVDPANTNPPDMTKAPHGPYLRERLHVRVPFVMGLCQDEMGYLVEPFNFQLAEGSDAYIEEPDGDHYEETNSVGPLAVPALLSTMDRLFAAEAIR